MSKRLSNLLREALEFVTASLGRIGEESGIHWVTLSRWRSGAIEGKPESARALARALRRRGQRLIKLADRIERETNKPH